MRVQAEGSRNPGIFFTYFIKARCMYVPDNCWLLHLLLSDSSQGSTKLSGRGKGQVFERALDCGSKLSCCSSTRVSIWRPSLDMPSIILDGDDHMAKLSIFFYFITQTTAAAASTRRRYGMWTTPTESRLNYIYWHWKSFSRTITTTALLDECTIHQTHSQTDRHLPGAEGNI